MKNLSTQWPDILKDRLTYSSQSVSTAFYMADKAFIDSVVRLRNLYQEASKEMFPIRDGAYPKVSYDLIKDGQVVYGLSMYCNWEDKTEPRFKAVDRLH